MCHYAHTNHCSGVKSPLVIRFLWPLLFQVDKMLAEDISKLMVMIPQEDKMIRTEGTGGNLEGGAFDTMKVRKHQNGFGKEK